MPAAAARSPFRKPLRGLARRALVGVSTAVLACFGFFQSCRSVPVPPNVVIFLLDDVGFAQIGSFGGLIPGFERLF